MRSKRLVLYSFFALCGAALVEGQASLNYSTNPFYPPYDWALGDDRFDGASVELLSLVLPPDVRAKPVRVPWKRAFSMAAIGEIDLLLSLRVAPERSEYLAFTTHRAFPNPIAVFVLAGSAITADEWAALKPYVGGVSLGDTFGGGFDEYWRSCLIIETAPSMIENFEKLRRGRIDYFVTGLYMGESYLAATGLDSEFVALRPFISDQDVFFGFSRKSPWVRLLPDMSAALEELDSKGVLESLLKKHLARFYGADVPLLFSRTPD